LRVHRTPVHCARCSNTFTTEDERDTHLRQQPQCPIEPPRNWDGISESQKRQLAKRVSSKKTKEENWYFIYETLFPNSERPNSPFVDDIQLSEELLALREFALREAPDRITQFVDSELPPDLRPNRGNVEAFTQAAIRGVFDILLERWESSSLPNRENTENATLRRSNARREPIGQETKESAVSSSEHQSLFSQSAMIVDTEAQVSVPATQNVLSMPSYQHITQELHSAVSDSMYGALMGQSEVIANVAAVMGSAWDFEETYDSSFDFDALFGMPNLGVADG
jgi:hypothetical protein